VCSKAGTDASRWSDCQDLGPNAGNTVTNPFSCFTKTCPGTPASWGTICCRHTKPICVASVSSNPAFNLSLYFSEDDRSCSLGTGGGCHQNGVPVFAFANKTAQDSVKINLWLFPDKVMPGAKVDIAILSQLPAECAGMQQVSLTQGGKTCTSWSGIVTFKAPVPSFSVVLDLKCTEMGKTDLALAGTFTGDY
jgi:hypothetical protein